MHALDGGREGDFRERGCDCEWQSVTAAAAELSGLNGDPWAPQLLSLDASHIQQFTIISFQFQFHSSQISIIARHKSKSFKESGSTSFWVALPGY